MAWYEGAVQSRYFLNKIEELLGNHPTEWEVVGHHKASSTSGDGVGVIFRPVNVTDQSYMTYGISMPYLTVNYTSQNNNSYCVCLNVTQFRGYVPNKSVEEMGTFTDSWLRNLNISPNGRSSNYSSEFLGGTSPIRYLISIKPTHITMILAHVNGTGNVLYNYVHFGKLLNPVADGYVDVATLYTGFYTRYTTITGFGIDNIGSQKCSYLDKNGSYSGYLKNHTPAFKYNKGSEQIAFDNFIASTYDDGIIGRLPIKSLQFTKGVVDKDLLDIDGVEYIAKLLDTSSLGTYGYSFYGFLSQDALHAIEKS